WSWAGYLSEAFVRQGYIYNIFYIILIYFFCYFWTAITFNPKDMADNLKDYGSFIPGYRPGKRTADYLERVIMRITYVGAAFLAIVAIIPSVISSGLEVDYRVASFYGGTGLHIVTGDILREAIQLQTPAGKQAEPYVTSGRLVPDTIVNELVADRFRRRDRPERFVMDGYPRTVQQAAFFDEVLRQHSLDLTAV